MELEVGMTKKATEEWTRTSAISVAFGWRNDVNTVPMVESSDVVEQQLRLNFLYLRWTVVDGKLAVAVPGKWNICSPKRSGTQ